MQIINITYKMVLNRYFYYLPMQNSCKNTEGSTLPSYQMHPYLVDNFYITCEEKFQHLSNFLLLF